MGVSALFVSPGYGLVTGLHHREKSAVGSSFFSGLAEEDARAMLGAASRQKIPAGRVVIEGGDKADRFFLLDSGRAKYYRLTKLGDEVLLWSLSPGDVFGLGSLLRHPTRYIGSAEATKDSELYVWERDAILDLARKYPQLAANSLQIVLHYLSLHSDRLVSLITENAEQKLARALLHLGDESGRPGAKGVEVDATNEHMGALANVSPFTASRLLKKWERSGTITKMRGKIAIHYPEELVVD
jgi:CRP/FNR family transcriptional regulator, nitrogen oxide reductase regulator